MSKIKIVKTEGFPSYREFYRIDSRLSLKAKGLLTQLVVYAYDDEFCLEDLACINKDKVQSIRAALRELEEIGYLYRQQGRNELGQMLPVEYTIFENPYEGMEFKEIMNDYDYTKTEDDPLQELLDKTAEVLNEIQRIYFT